MQTILTRKWAILIVFLLIGLLTVGFVFIPQMQLSQHCVGPVQSTETQLTPLPTPDPDLNASIVCFETQAEAIEYATDGAVRLPKTATSEEISQALRAYYADLTTP